MVEAIIRDPATRWQALDTFTAKGLAVVVGRDWTLIVQHDGPSIYPVTLYPTQRGSRRRRQP